MNYLCNMFSSKSPDLTIMYYYQSFNNKLKDLIDIPNNINIYISSIHFGKTFDGEPYINLNNDVPDNHKSLLEEIEYISKNTTNIKFLAMIGGAGGAYSTFFSDFETYYKLLYNFIESFNIKGVDLDIEETTSIKNIEKLILRLKNDFGKEFIISMAPIANSMISDTGSMAGFIYKDLFKSEAGKLIDWFNIQCYYCYNQDTFDKIIKNGYPANKIVIGMLGDEFTNETYLTAIKEFKKFYIKNNVKGVILWEYGDSNIDVIEWAKHF